MYEPKLPVKFHRSALDALCSLDDRLRGRFFEGFDVACKDPRGTMPTQGGRGIDRRQHTESFPDAGIQITALVQIVDRCVEVTRIIFTPIGRG